MKILNSETEQSQDWDETHENAWLQISEMSREHYQEVYQRLGDWDEAHENAWLQIIEMSREHYQEVYQRLGVRVEEVSCFDPFYKVRLHISATLDLLREKGLTVESERDKAILIEGRKLPLIELTALCRPGVCFLQRKAAAEKLEHTAEALGYDAV
nr:arginine--tRNA ligase, cytoplasmic-like isoform X1 [Tanacetum cinerariifolium]